jgi:hypothetical protein
MRTVRTLLCLIVLLSLIAAPVLAGPAAEPGKTSPPRSTADVVDVSVRPAELTAEAGGEVSFQVHLAIADTWHLYDHSYTEDPEAFFIGLDMVPGEDAALAGYKAIFPEGEHGEFMGEKVVMLHHDADIDVTVQLPADASGEVAIPLVVSAQACDDKVCLRPSDIPVTALVRVQ